MAAETTARWKVPLADVVISEEEIAAISAVYRSGWLTQGPLARAFEVAMETYTGAPHAIAVTNCTAALHLMVTALGLGPGDEVIMPALTFVATANSVAYTGAKPVFADIVSPTEPWLDPLSVADCITPRTRAIMSMAYAGHPGCSLELRELAAQHDLFFLEDAAHALGTRIGGRHVGTLGTAGAYSFFSNKNLPVGEGGMIVCADDSLADKLRLLRSHGMTSLSWDRHRGHASTYDVVALGYNYRIDEPRCALGLSRLHNLDHDNARRAQIDARYRSLLTHVKGVEAALEPPVGAVLAHHLFTVVLAPEIDREAARAALAADGIQTSVHYPPAHRFELYTRDGTVLPVTEEYARRTVSLPLFPHMTDEQTQLVVDGIERACRQ
jgi:dTDP-4-amino-4,6-dideoxygalactose transaminase